MGEPGRTMLERECAVFGRYLIGVPPTAYVVSRYLVGQASIPPASLATQLVDRALLAFARRGTAATGVSDAYAALFRRRSLLRCKLVLLVAILEHSGEQHGALDTAIAASRPAALARLALLGAGFALRLAVAIPLFAPLHLVGASRPATPRPWPTSS